MSDDDDVKPLHVRPDPVVLEAQRRWTKKIENYKTIAEIVKEVCIENACDGVMYGDVFLLDECADRCKHTNLMSLHPMVRHQRILNALDKSSLFEKWYVQAGGFSGKLLVRCFKIKKEEKIRK